MKNLNIYTFRELIKMYIDERPMPDVAFVTQTEAMKLQSMGKEMNNNKENTMDTMNTMNNAQWITDRKPRAKDADYEKMVWYSDGKVTYRVEWTDIIFGDAWMPIDIPPVYVKPKRFQVKYHPSGMYIVYDSIDGNEVADLLPTLEAAERVAAIYEEMLP